MSILPVPGAMRTRATEACGAGTPDVSGFHFLFGFGGGGFSHDKSLCELESLGCWAWCG